MLNKTLPVAALSALLFLLSVPLAPDAAAYRDVCVRFPAGIGYTSKFRVEYGDAETFHRAPLIDVRRQTWRWEIRELERVGHLARARGKSEWSPRMSYDMHHCIPLDDVREGEHFAVLLQVDSGWDDLVYVRYCRGWKAGEAMVFPQNPRDTRRLMLKAWGVVTKSECAADWVR